MWATSSPMSAPLRPCGRPFRHHLHHHRRRDKLIAGMGTPKSRSLIPYGWFFHQHLHRQAGNGSLPPSAPKTPPTYAQMTSHNGNGSLPQSAPKTPPTDAKVHLDLQYGWRKRDNRRKLQGFLDTYPGEINLTRNDTSKSPFSSPRPPGSWTTPCLGLDTGGNLNIDIESTSLSYTQMMASTEADKSRTVNSNMSETLPEKLDKQSSINYVLLYIVLYYSVHSVLVLYNHVRVWGELCSEPHIV
jgi:hypothetical protein